MTKASGEDFHARANSNPTNNGTQQPAKDNIDNIHFAKFLFVHDSVGSTKNKQQERPSRVTKT